VTLEIGLLLAIIAIALVLFAFEWVPADVIALGVLLLLILTGLVPADRAFSGFGSDTVMLILGLLILTASLLRTGVVDMAGRFILKIAGKQPIRLVVAIMIATAVLSAFISNTAATAFFLPVAIGAAAKARVSASGLLMPLAFSSILTSSVSLISTSTNIVVSNTMTRYGMPPMGMFELAPVGLPISVVGLLYILFIGRRLLPQRDQRQLTEQFGLRPYLTEILIRPKSNLIGKTLAESGLGEDLDLTVLQVVRDKRRFLGTTFEIRLQEGDILLVEGLREEILKIKDTAGLDIKADVTLSDPNLEAEDIRLAEILIMPRSPLIHRSLKGFGFRERYGLQVLAINRHGETLFRKLSEVWLKMGDVLLVQGRRAKIAALEADNTLRVLGAVEGRRPNLRRAPLAVAIFTGALVAATFNILALPVAMLLGALLCFLTHCITPEDAYREIEWKVLILIGSLLGLGLAMDETGTAKFLASHMVDIVGGSNPIGLLSAFFILTVLLTQPMSNQAAAIVILPVAIQTALQLGLNPRSFAMMIAVAASCSYLTPLEPSCLMVYGPGHYRFADFLKVGALLTVLIYLITVTLVPRVWPLF
jgi:di/tricarboxylate transporter